MNAGLTYDEQMNMPPNHTMDRVLKKRRHSSILESRPPMAIFIHAGAGYHSLQNENIHLAVCSKCVSP